MRRSTRTEKDWLFGQTSDTSSGDLLKGGNTENCNSMGGTQEEVVALLYSEVKHIRELEIHAFRPADNAINAWDCHIWAGSRTELRLGIAS